MCNGLPVNALAREMGREFSAEQVAALQAGHARVFRELAPHRQELEVASAFRVYHDPAALRIHLDELGIRR
jgi:hypothetical protein